MSFKGQLEILIESQFDIGSPVYEERIAPQDVFAEIRWRGLSKSCCGQPLGGGDRIINAAIENGRIKDHGALGKGIEVQIQRVASYRERRAGCQANYRSHLPATEYLPYEALLIALAQGLAVKPVCDIAVCVPAPYLAQVLALKATESNLSVIDVGVQDVSMQAAGANYSE